jgi:flagellar biosynthetic protein FliR
MISLAGIVTALLVACRLGSAIMFMPIFSTMGVPKEARIGALMTLTLVITPIVPMAPDYATLPLLLLAVAAEVTVGVIMGGAVNLLFAAMSVGTELISMQIGLAMASFFDPMQKTTQSPLAILANLCAGMVFVLSDLHLVMIASVAESFQIVPPGQIEAPIKAGAVWLPMFTEMLQVGVGIAGPIVCLTFSVNLFVGLLMKLAPKMNVFFALGMIVTQMSGLLMIFLSFPLILDVHHDFVAQGGKWITVIATVAGTP